MYLVSSKHMRALHILLRDLSILHPIYKLTLESLEIRQLKVYESYLEVLLNSNKEQHSYV